MRLSPSSKSGESACSGKTSASKRWPATVPMTQEPPQLLRGLIFVICSVSRIALGSGFRVILVRRHRRFFSVGYAPMRTDT